MKFLNLTPHALTILSGDVTTHIPCSGPAPRLGVDREPLGELMDTSDGHFDGGTHFYDEDGMPWPCPVFPIVRSTMGEPTGLPEPQEGVILIVSALVAEHPSVSHRPDLAYPGEAIRDDSGKIIGAKGLCAGPGLAVSLREPIHMCQDCGERPGVNP